MNDIQKAQQIKRVFPAQAGDKSDETVVKLWKEYSYDLGVDWAYPTPESVNIVFGYAAPPRAI